MDLLWSAAGTAVALALCLPVWADLAVPAWFDADWHYRVPINLPAGAASGSTLEFDVDFDGLLDDLNIDTASVTFDVNSPRIVRSSGALATQQEYSDRVYAGVLDPAANARGQIRFILEDSVASGDYFLYFDILENGAKPANPATVINGDFENSAGTVPTSWVRSAVNAGGNQDNDVYATALGDTVTVGGGCGHSGAGGVDASPNSSGGTATGRNWLLLGYRNNCEDGTGNELIRLSRDIRVPSGASAGVLEFYFQVQGWDGINNGANYDWFVFYVNGIAVNHTALSIDNSTAPQLRIDTSRLGRNRWGSTIADHGWKRAQLSLAPYAGSTINFRIESRHSASDNSYKSWVKVDDVVWSLATATLGDAQGFGVNVVDPLDTAVGPASTYGVGQTITLRAQVDAVAASVSADIYDEASTPVATAVTLFDDGTHGDAVASDNIWTNDGSDGGFPTYTVLDSDPFGAGWLVRVFAPDQSVAQGSVTDGLIHIPSRPTTPEEQINFYNVDDQVFTVRGAVIDMSKTLAAIQDGYSATIPKSIPGAWIRYSVRIENEGPDALDSDSIVVTDALPVEVAVCVIAACNGAAQAVEFDDTGSPIPTGLTGINISYSTDGVDFTYPPVPDADGFDVNVRYVRVIPIGSMSAPVGPDNAEFDLRYTVRVE